MDRAEAIKELEPFTLCDVYSDNLRGACRMAIAALREQEGKDTNVLTNADRIRAMTDEELAEFMDRCEMSDIDYGKTFCDLCDGSLDCDKCRLDWLQQPCGGADHGK